MVGQTRHWRAPSGSRRVQPIKRSRWKWLLAGWFALGVASTVHAQGPDSLPSGGVAGSVTLEEIAVTPPPPPPPAPGPALRPPPGIDRTLLMPPRPQVHQSVVNPVLPAVPIAAQHTAQAGPPIVQAQNKIEVPGNPPVIAQQPPPVGEKPAPDPDTLSTPRLLDMLGDRSLLAGGENCGLDALELPPNPSAKELERYKKFVSAIVDPRNTLMVVKGHSRLLIFNETPKRIQIADEKVATYSLITPRELSLIGQDTGATVLNLWFANPDDPNRDIILSYLVNVTFDPYEYERRQRTLKTITAQIAHAFPDSNVCLFMIGNRLAVSGEAKDVAEAAQILRIAAAAAPQYGQQRGSTADLFLNPSGYGGQQFNNVNNLNLLYSNIINLLRIPGEQQVMLRVCIAEVNRAAARSIGLNFGITNKNGVTVFQNLTGNIAGSNGLAGSGSSSSGGAAVSGTSSFGSFFSLFGFPFGTNVANVNPLNNLNALNNMANNGVSGLGNMFGNNFNNLNSATNNLPFALDNGRVRAALNALRNMNYARTLAEPTIAAMNGQNGSFQAGGQFPVPVVTGNTFNGLQGVQFVPYGVLLNFTPFITDRDRVRLSVAAEVSTRDLGAGTMISGGAVSGLTTRNFRTTVELREGQTLAVAGLIQNNLGADSTRVPFLGDLPIIGRAWGFDRITHGEQELVILLSPELVHPLNHKEVPPVPGSDLFEPGDLEFYLWGRLESRRSYDYRSPVMTDLDRMARYRHCEQIYIAGPHGHSDTPNDH